MRRLTILTALALLPLGAAAATLAPADRSFLRKAAMGGLAEVEEGKAAAANAGSASVKSFGAQMVSAHTENNQALTTLAAGKGVTLPSALDARHEKHVASITALTGPAFDAAYVKDQINGHETMAKVMQAEIDHGSDPDLKDFAGKTLPVVQDHLKMAQGLTP